MGAALAGPALRPQVAWATEKEPCFVPCVNAAGAKWGTARSACDKTATVGQTTFLGSLYYANALMGLTAIFQMAGSISCFSSSELTWHREMTDCRGSECGNGSKYPEWNVAASAEAEAEM